MPDPPVNKRVDDVSDAQLALSEWIRAVQLQLRRLETSDELSIDAQFAIFAVSKLVRACRMLVDHSVPGVEEALGNFRERQPLERPLRNAVEHFDEYLRGQGRSAPGVEWFVYRVIRRDSGVYVGVPPLDDHDATDVDLTQLLLDAGRLAQEIEVALRNDGRRRLSTSLDELRNSARRSSPEGGLSDPDR